MLATLSQLGSYIVVPQRQSRRGSNRDFNRASEDDHIHAYDPLLTGKASKSGTAGHAVSISWRQLASERSCYTAQNE